MKIPLVFYALGALVALALIGSAVQRAHQGTDRAAQDALHAALQDVARQKSMVDFLTTRGSLAEARADSEARRADSLERASVRTRVQYVTVKATAPAGCDTLAAAADNALAASDSVAAELRAALQSSQDAATLYRAGMDTARAALARLSVSAAAVDKARPSTLSRLLPRTGIGAAAGVNPLTGRPSATIGLTFGWTF